VALRQQLNVLRGFVLWAFVTGQLRLARHGKMGMRSG
jgi:hypothetical protein